VWWVAHDHVEEQARHAVDVAQMSRLTVAGQKLRTHVGGCAQSHSAFSRIVTLTGDNTMHHAQISENGRTADKAHATWRDVKMRKIVALDTFQRGD